MSNLETINRKLVRQELQARSDTRISAAYYASHQLMRP
jgi:hypothetical protein